MYNGIGQQDMLNARKAEAAMLAYSPPTVRQTLEMSIKDLKDRLANYESILEQLDAIPNVEKLLDSMRKAGI